MEVIALVAGLILGFVIGAAWMWWQWDKVLDQYERRSSDK